MQKKNYSQQNVQNETMLQYTRWDLWTALADLLTIFIKGKGIVIICYYVIICEVIYWEQALFWGNEFWKLAPLKTYFSYLVNVFGNVLMLDWVKEASASEGNGCKWRAGQLFAVDGPWSVLVPAETIWHQSMLLLACPLTHCAS